MKLNLGNGLLNSSSLAAAVGDYNIRYIPYEQLNPIDEQHGYSLNGIEELAESIADVGLEQSLVVEDAGDGTYSILTGRRRYYAIGLLLKNGNDRYSKVPCKIKKLSDIDLPLSDEGKRRYAIVTTNLEQRKPTAADTAEMIRQLNSVYDELAANGSKPKGRRREFIAKELGMSPATVGRYEYIEKNADENAKAHLQEGKTGLRETLEETKNKNCAHVSTTENSPCILRKEALFVLPYSDFSKEKYELNAETYEKVMKKIQQIRTSYKGILKLLDEKE